MLPLGRELQQRGHHVTLFGIADAQTKTLAAGLDFQVIGASEFPVGTLAQFCDRRKKLRGFAAMQYTINFRQQSWATVLLRDAPKAIARAGVDALLVDQVLSGGGTVAEILSIPFITICSALPLNQEDSIPPFFAPWQDNPALWARLRNQAAYLAFEQVRQLIHKAVNEYRQEWKLPPYTHPNAPFSQLAQLSQQPAEFEFPRQHLPPYFHFTGCYHNSLSRQPVEFPYEKLTGQPLIYASMGTLQNHLFEIFHCVASACMGLNAQLVISLGGGKRSESLLRLPGNPIVVEYAPQLELLKRATLTITHAGLNTTLESLSNGVPLVAIPITDDQPGVGARLARTGAGEVVSKFWLTVPRLRAAIERVLSCDSYKQNALRLQEAIARAGGVSRAADIVELAVSTGKPVLANGLKIPANSKSLRVASLKGVHLQVPTSKI